MKNSEENEKDQLEDTIIIMDTALKAAKEQKVGLEKFCAKIAGVMEKLKTDSAKQELAEITQVNFKKMIELEIRIAEMETSLKAMKLQALFN